MAKKTSFALKQLVPEENPKTGTKYIVRKPTKGLKVAEKLRMKKYDPIEASSKTQKQLAQLADENDLIAAKSSLDANLFHWKNGKQIKCRDWIKELLLDVTPLAKELDMFALLQPIESVLTNGNQSMKWLNSYSKGVSIQSLLQKGISEMEQEETNFIQMNSTY